MSDSGYPQQTPGRAYVHSASQSHYGLVGRYVYKRKGVFKYTPKGCKNQIVTAGRLLAILDMRPSTTINPTSNQDPKFTAPSNYTLGTITDPKLIQRRSQTSPDTRWRHYGLVAYIFILTRSSCPSH